MILDHATHFAGRGAIELLNTRECPLCYVNRKNPAGLNLDGWIENAADDAAAAPSTVHSPLVIAH